MIRHLLIFGLLTLALSGNSQGRLDSLAAAYEQMSVEDKFYYHLELGDSAYYSDFDSSKKHYEDAVAFAQKSEELALEADGWYALGVLYWDRGDYGPALDCDHRTLNIYLQLKDEPNIAMATMGMGVTLSEMGMNQLAMEKYIVARDMYIKQKDWESLCLLYMNMGVAFSSLGKSPEAMSKYLEALRIADSLNLPGDRADIYLNLGSELEDSLSHESLIYYEKALEIYEAEDYQSNIALVLGNLAGTHTLLGDYGKAQSFATRGRILAEKINDQASLAYLHYVLADLNLGMKKYPTAIAHLDSSQGISDTYDYLHQTVDNLYLRGEIFAGMGDYEKAFEYSGKYISFKDSLELANDANRTDQMMVVFENEKRDKQIALLQAEVESDETLSTLKTILLGVSVFALLALAFFGFSRYRALAQSRKANLELQTLNSQLAHEKKMAEAGMRAKTEFLSTMTHELRTPLNAVLGAINMMLMDKHTPEQKENLDILKFSSTNLLHLINNILDFSKLEANKVLLEQHEVRLHELLNQILGGNRVTAKAKRIDLKGQWNADLPKIIRSDATRLTQVLTNLIGNAIKFTDEGEVILRVESPSSTSESCRLKFSVIDTGIGISQDKQNLIFESFSQGEEFITRKYGGTGLGLAISRRIVEMLGGTLSVKSEPNVGSEFSFEMECPIVAHSEARSVDASLTPEEIIKLQDRKILVVDDNKLNLLVTSNMLAMKGIDVDQAQSGLEALELCSDQHYDLIFMDLQMPEMDGYEATSRIMEATKGTRIVALTAGSKEEMELREEAALFEGFLRKPVNLNQMLETLKAIA